MGLRWKVTLQIQVKVPQEEVSLKIQVQTFTLQEP